MRRLIFNLPEKSRHYLQRGRLVSAREIAQLQSPTPIGKCLVSEFKSQFSTMYVSSHFVTEADITQVH